MNDKKTLTLDDFEILGEIGSGTNGTVYKAKLMKEGEEFYAIKKINLSSKSQDMVKEVFMLKNIVHPNIIK